MMSHSSFVCYIYSCSFFVDFYILALTFVDSDVTSIFFTLNASPSGRLSLKLERMRNNLIWTCIVVSCLKKLCMRRKVTCVHGILERTDNFGKIWRSKVGSPESLFVLIMYWTLCSWACVSPFPDIFVRVVYLVVGAISLLLPLLQNLF